MGSYPDGELSPQERQELRRILETQHRTEWLWSTIRVWATWIAVVIAGVYAVMSILRDSIRALIGNAG